MGGSGGKKQTIGTTFLSNGSYIVYGGTVLRPEDLGNYTYGYLGAAFGFSYQTLTYGSMGAAGLPTSIADLLNEAGDEKYIYLGYLNYYISRS
ncbi:MAG: polymorphic toxin type 44 domain-containing protein [Oscillospiraceae bacterium]